MCTGCEAATKSPSPTECRAERASMTLRHRQHRKDELGWRQSYDANSRGPRKKQKRPVLDDWDRQINGKRLSHQRVFDLFTSAWWVIGSHRTVFWAWLWSDMMLFVHQSEVWSVLVKYWFQVAHLYSHYPSSLAAPLNLLDYWSLVGRGRLESALIKGSSLSSRLTTARWITDIRVNFMRHNRGFFVDGGQKNGDLHFYLNGL